MSFSSLSSEQLRRLIKLVHEKETLQARVAKIDRALQAMEGGSPPTRQTSPKLNARRGTRKRHGALKTSLISKLEDAGKSGLTVKELAASLRAKPATVYAWFYTTGQKIAGIKKVGKAKFAYLPK